MILSDKELEAIINAVLKRAWDDPALTEVIDKRVLRILKERSWETNRLDPCGDRIG